MKFKSIFFSLCLLFIGATSFAATADLAPANGDDPLTLEEANKQVQEVLASLPTDSDFSAASVTKIVEDDASCTVSAEVTVMGQSVSVSATAETCGAALEMIIDIF